MDMTANFTMNVSDNVTLFVYVNNLNLNVDGSYNNTVKVSLLKLKTEILLVTNFVRKTINDMFAGGLSVNNFI